MNTITDNPIETKLRQDLKTVCNLLYNRGLISGFDGNVSLRISEDLFLITPRDSHKGLLKEEDFVIVDLEGNSKSFNNDPSSDFSIHASAYRKRTDIKAFIHAHPPTAVSISIANINVNKPILPDVVVLLGEVSTIQYPGIEKEKELNLIVKCLEKSDLIILEKHGAIAVGDSIFNALHKLETLEYACKILLNSTFLGEAKTLSEEEVKLLINERHRIYGKELEEREGKNLFQSVNRNLNLKNILKNVIESDKPVFQRILSLVNEINLNTIENTSYSKKLNKEEKELLARELTGSFLSMIIGRFTNKPK